MDSILRYEQDRLNIKKELLNLVDLIHSENSGNRESLIIAAENFFMRFLNTLYSWKLQNANRIKQNAKGIDLIDTENRIVVQVSSTMTHGKVQDSLDKSRDYPGYRFFFLAIAKERPKYHAFTVPNGLDFDVSKHVFSVHELMGAVDKLDDVETLKALAGLVEVESTRLELCNYLDQLLENTRKAHPSFKLMQPDKLDERLFPGIKAVEAFETKGRHEETDTPSSVWGLIAESWNGFAFTRSPMV